MRSGKELASRIMTMDRFLSRLYTVINITWRNISNKSYINQDFSDKLEAGTQARFSLHFLMVSLVAGIASGKSILWGTASVLKPADIYSTCKASTTSVKSTN